MKSKFDTGKWSSVNGLPGQDDMINYLHFLLKADPNKCYSRQNLMDAMTNEFGIMPEKADADCPNCDTGALYTRLTYLICDALNGVRKATEAFMKRVGLNEYQHITGDRPARNRVNGSVNKVSEKLVGQAVVSVKILKELNHSADQIEIELCDSGKWQPPVIKAAIKRIFV